jgi:hypothetical protein
MTTLDSYRIDPSISKSAHITFDSPTLYGFLRSKEVLRKSNKKYIRLTFTDNKLTSITILKILSDSTIVDNLVKYRIELTYPLTPYPNYFIKDMFITELIGYPAFMKSPDKVLLYDYSKILLKALNLNENDFDNRVLYGNQT